MSFRPRILVAVEPRLLGDVLAELLVAIDADEVVRVGDEGSFERFDAVLVSDGRPAMNSTVTIDATGSPHDVLARLDRAVPVGIVRTAHARLVGPSHLGGAR